LEKEEKHKYCEGKSRKVEGNHGIYVGFESAVNKSFAREICTHKITQTISANLL